MLAGIIFMLIFSLKFKFILKAAVFELEADTFTAGISEGLAFVEFFAPWYVETLLYVIIRNGPIFVILSN